MKPRNTADDMTVAILGLTYSAGWVCTFVYLTLLDESVRWTWWNWIVLLPMHAFLSAIWPIYWALLRWLF